ncbi:hypothetical protein GMRT_22695 [Giardia muris]|uniref:Uncharacterized protein n=1 Tax=Giardia muris TaxID=5742 RepID=A0A4Z1SZZ2_GIAMU|nr:hypothetical protein GMRT_22695 [Giardia muris]|eukprot:TNJ29028.1 hypothetical protein GMRT_22695 [Giardia muris]
MQTFSKSLGGVIGPRLELLRPPRRLYLGTVTDLQFSARELTARCRQVVVLALDQARYIHATTLLTDYMNAHPQTKLCAEVWLFRAEFELATMRRTAAIDTLIEGLRQRAEPMELLAEAYRIATGGRTFSVKKAPQRTISIPSEALEVTRELCRCFGVGEKWGSTHHDSTEDDILRREALGLPRSRSHTHRTSKAMEKSPLNVPNQNLYQRVVQEHYKERVDPFQQGLVQQRRQVRRRASRTGQRQLSDWFDLIEEGACSNGTFSEPSFSFPELPRQSCAASGTDSGHQSSRQRSMSQVYNAYGHGSGHEDATDSFSSVFSSDGEGEKEDAPERTDNVNLPPLMNHGKPRPYPPRVSAFDLDKRAMPFLSSQVN